MTRAGDQSVYDARGSILSGMGGSAKARIDPAEVPGISDFETGNNPPHQTAPLIGLTTLSPAKSLSLSLTTTHSFAPATAAMIMSSPLRG